MVDEPTDVAAQRDGRQLAAMSSPAIASLAAALIVFGATLVRQVGVPKVATMWAEDGTVFLQCVYDSGAFGCFGQPYQGYLHLVPRTIAAVAGSLPPVGASATIVVLSALVAAAAAAVAGRSIADATASPLAGLLGGVGLALVWQAGREVGGNSANVHWILLAATSIAIVCSWLGARITRGTIMLAAVTGLTSAISPLIAALAVGSVIRHRPGAWLLFAVSASTATVQLLAELTSERSGMEPGLVAGTLAHFFRSEVIRRGFFGPLPMPAGLLVPILLVVALVGIGWVVRERPLKLSAIIGVGFLVGIGVVVCSASIVLGGPNPRYAFLPTAMTVAALSLAGGYLATGLGRGADRARRVGRIVMPGMLVLVGVGFALSFRLESRASPGPDVPRAMEAATAACPEGTTVTIPISPIATRHDWSIAIPCDRLMAP